MVLVHDTSSRRGLQVYQVSLKNLERFSSYRADTICDGQTDRRTDGQTDRRTGKNNMSPDPVGGRHNYNYTTLNYTITTLKTILYFLLSNLVALFQNIV